MKSSQLLNVMEKKNRCEKVKTGGRVRRTESIKLEQFYFAGQRQISLEDD